MGGDKMKTRFFTRLGRLALIVSAGVVAGAASMHAQGCTMPAETDFKVVSLIPGHTMSNPSHMTVLPNGEIFAIEQWSGKVWHYVPGGATTNVGTVPTIRGPRSRTACRASLPIRNSTKIIGYISTTRRR